jgi:hypothetical protein
VRATLATLLVLAASGLAAPAAGQPLAFGSADDPLERGSAVRERDRAQAHALAGPAYLPDTWRTAVRLAAEGRRGRWSLAVGGTVHPGAGGLYSPEADEAYDAARLLRYARLNPTATSPVYARLGPVQGVTLGSGALVRGYRTTAAWDERAVGFEGAVRGRALRAGAVVGDLRLNGVVGGEVGVRSGLAVGPVRRIGLRVAGVHDLGRPGLAGDSALTGVEATVRGALDGAGPVGLAPFVTYARYLGRGGTAGAGLDVGADNLGDAVGARARIAVFASSAGFVPGHVGPFYGVNGGPARIVDDEAFFDAGRAAGLVGTPLDSLGAGVDVVLDLRAVVFGRAEVSQHVRRHVGPEAASAYGLRLAGRLPGGGRVAFALEREGFRGFFDLVSTLGDQNTLVLDVALPVGRRGLVFVRSRYGYRLLTADDGPAYGPGGPPRYLVERRFEPLVGLRFDVE